MSLKDRLNLNTSYTELNAKADALEEKELSSDSQISLKKEENFNITLFESLLSEGGNILVCTPMDVLTYNAINFLCSKIPNDKRLVGIGSNLLLNPDEIIKFEPETKNQSKELIKTALSLNPYKIILQDFDGVEAVDIFKLTNGGIKNIIGAVVADDPQKALEQAELNLYLSGINIPESVMKRMLCNLFKVVVVVKPDTINGYQISGVFEIKPPENNEYKLLEIKKDNDDVNSSKTNHELIGKTKDVIETAKPDEVKSIEKPKKNRVKSDTIKKVIDKNTKKAVSKKNDNKTGDISEEQIKKTQKNKFIEKLKKRKQK